MTRNDPALSGIGPKGAWLALRSLCAMHSAGWVRYVGAEDRPLGKHVIDLNPSGKPVYRLLVTVPRFYTARHRPSSPQDVGDPGEAWWYALGQADQRGEPSVVEGLLRERVPKLYTLDEAAEAMDLTVFGVQHHLRTGQAYPLVVVDATSHRRQRHLFAAQVAARAGGARAVERWREIRAQIPALVSTHAIPESVAFPAAPDPLPVDRLLRPVVRQREAVAIGHKAGWFRLAGQSAAAFTLRLPDGRTREVPGRAVLPWVLGMGDARGEGARVMYRNERG